MQRHSQQRGGRSLGRERRADIRERQVAGEDLIAVGDAVAIRVGDDGVGAERGLIGIRDTVAIGVRLERIGSVDELGVVVDGVVIAGSPHNGGAAG